MISILRGTVASVGLDHIDIVVGGIGFRVHVTPAFAQGASRDQEMTVFTSMIVREDSMTLYGFESADERDVFTKLLSVSGIGPKIALAALPGAETTAAPAPTEDAVASEVSAALVGLGWSEAQAAKAIEKLAGSGLGASDMLRAALVTLGGGRG